MRASSKMTILAVVLSCSSAALAADPAVGPAAPLAPAAEAPALPLAVPVGPRVGPAPALPGAPALTVERLATLRAYKAQRLSVREETELRGGGTSMAMGYPMGRLGGTTTFMVTDPIYTVHTWGVYQGPDRISTPDFLAVAGHKGEADALRSDIQRYDARSKRRFGAAGLGAGAVIAGLVGMRVATTPEQYLAWNLATLGGSAVGISGLIAGTFPAAKAGRLERSPSAVMEPGRARSLAQEHNDALQAKLGVTPQEAWLLELGDDR
jgi:hypothetical protein